MPSPSPSTSTLLYAALLASASALLASLLTSRHLALSKAAARLADGERLSKKAKAKAEKQKEEGEPSGTLITDVKVEKIYLWEVEQLGSRFKSAAKGNLNRMKNAVCASTTPSTSPVPPSSSLDSSSPVPPVTDYVYTESEYNKLITNHECILADIKHSPSTPTSVRAYVRAGPRKHLHFDPKVATAAIVTCGGLCPGLNNVIREITNSCIQLYGVKRVLGVRGG